MQADWRPIETISRNTSAYYLFYCSGSVQMGTLAGWGEEASHWDYLPEPPISARDTDGLIADIEGWLPKHLPSWDEIKRRLKEAEDES